MPTADRSEDPDGATIAYVFAALVIVIALPGLIDAGVALSMGDAVEAVLLLVGWLAGLALWLVGRALKEPATSRLSGRRRWGGVLLLALALVVARPTASSPASVMAWTAWSIAALVAFAEVRGAIAARGLGRSPEVAGPTAAGRAPTMRGRSRSAWRPSRYGVADLSRWLGLGETELLTATPTYATFLIPKRRRAAGSRTIRAPDQRTKALQRLILRRVLARLPAHVAVHGFEHARSIATNAREHTGRDVVVSIDLREFFATTSERRVRRFFRVVGWDRESAHVLSRLTTLGGGLPQGAPTSPRLANLVNIGLDTRLERLAQRGGATYTRYADDLTFSWPTDDPRAVRRIIGGVRRVVARDGYELNDRKVRVMRRHQRQLVTGLVVNEHPQLPRGRRRWLRAVENHLRTGRPATLTPDQLRGWQGLGVMISSQAAAFAPGGARPPKERKRL
ncbi:MAG: reverse transcriptase family protein [Chloroflexota bacterium]